jgi:hypothetical protein
MDRRGLSKTAGLTPSGDPWLLRTGLTAGVPLEGGELLTVLSSEVYRLHPPGLPCHSLDDGRLGCRKLDAHQESPGLVMGSTATELECTAYVQCA